MLTCQQKEPKVRACHDSSMGLATQYNSGGVRSFLLCFADGIGALVLLQVFTQASFPSTIPQYTQNIYIAALTLRSTDTCPHL